MLAAGLKGIEEGYELPPEAEDNVWSLSDGERRALGYAPLPASLDHALEYMEESELVAETLGEQVFNYVLLNKRREWQDYRAQVTPFELADQPRNALTAATHAASERSAACTDLARLGFDGLERRPTTVLAELGPTRHRPRAARAVRAPRRRPRRGARAASRGSLDRTPDARARRCRRRPAGSGDALWALLGASSGLRRLLPPASGRARAVLAAPASPCRTAGGAARRAAGGGRRAVDGFAAGRRRGPRWALCASRYRRLLARIAAVRPRSAVGPVALDAVGGGSLADLAGRGARGRARRRPARRSRQGRALPPTRSRATRLAIIGMGKAGARELNYVSDVDVIFVAERRRERRDSARAASSTSRRGWRCTTMRGITTPTSSRRSGRSTRTCGRRASSGALVRTLDSPPRPTTTAGRRAGSSRRC